MSGKENLIFLTCHSFAGCRETGWRRQQPGCVANRAGRVARKVVYLCEAQDIRHSGAKGQGTPVPGA